MSFSEVLKSLDFPVIRMVKVEKKKKNGKGVFVMLMKLFPECP